MERLVILGASGSIGTQTLDIINEHPNDFEIVGISVGHNIDRLNEILKVYPSIKNICVANKEDIKKVSFNGNIYSGVDGLNNLIIDSKPTLVVNALVGFVGLEPTLTTINNNIDVALANKETIVVGGELIKKALKNSRSKIYPIDSEHVAISKCLHGNEDDISKIILTASGGAFRNLSRDDLKDVKTQDALKHPSWSMGNKITIDCATMMNKGFEVIEACYLFNKEPEDVEILMHDESKVHSMILLKDGNYLADIGLTDMHNPIAYALYRGKRTSYHGQRLDLDSFLNLHFHKFDSSRYPSVKMVIDAYKKGGTTLCAINAANEELVYAFLDNRISFLTIEKLNQKIVAEHQPIMSPTLDDLKTIDQQTREYIRLLIKEV